MCNKKLRSANLPEQYIQQLKTRDQQPKICLLPFFVQIKSFMPSPRAEGLLCYRELYCDMCMTSTRIKKKFWKTYRVKFF